MAATAPLVIVGASYAGVQLAASARELGFEAPIVVLGDERHAPYQRPPLSKGLLSGKTRPEQLALRGPGFYAEQGIALELGRRACAIDPGARRLRLDDGRELSYGWLALATGARCRPLNLPGADLAGVLQLRTLDDALALDQAAARARRVGVVGGGFIGLEAASALRGRGLEVTLIESQPRLLARVGAPALSEYVAGLHQRRGVRLVCGRGLRALHGHAGQVQALELDDGSRLDCDLVLLGIGVLPNEALAAEAGIATGNGNGILTDALGRSSAPGVLAAGDVAAMAWPAIAAAGGPARLRLESIQAANDGARAAASVLVGREQPFTGVPWFWSDQYEHKFQLAGLALPGDQTVLRGDPQSERFTLFYLRGGALVAAHSVNRPAEHMLSRRLVAAGTRLAPAALADESFELRSALPPA